MKCLSDLQDVGSSPDLVIALYGLPRASNSSVLSLRNLVPRGSNFRIFIHSWIRFTPQPIAWHKIIEPVGLGWIASAASYTAAYPEEFTSIAFDRQYDYNDDILEKHTNKLNLIKSISSAAALTAQYCDAYGWKPSKLIITRQDVVFAERVVTPDMFVPQTVCHGGHFSAAKAGQLNAEDLIFITNYENIDIFKRFYSWAQINVASSEYNYSIQYFREAGLKAVYRDELLYGRGMVIDRTYAGRVA